ncbi:MAG: heparinase II/III family protein [Planctomycetota bacterium]
MRDALTSLAPHPRLFLAEASLQQLRSDSRKDETLQRFADQIVRNAEELLDANELRYQKRGPRLLHVSRECLLRVQTLGIAWRWSGEERFATRCRRDLMSVCGFADWNPSHFLDVAEMTHAVALGYDWLLPILPDAERVALRDAIVAKGLHPGLDCYRGKRAWWTKSAFNWNQVCNSGLLIGALAIAEHEPKLAEQIVASAVASLPIALASYEPDGAWMEGPAYWGYATHYTAYGLDALRTALGTDFGLSKRQGLQRAAWFPIYTAGPTGMFFNFADSREKSKRSPMPCVFWLARTYDENAFAAAEHDLLMSGKVRPMHLAWYEPPTAAPKSPKQTSTQKPRRRTAELARKFDGDVPVIVFRSEWDQPDALFLAIKGGYNNVNHGHLDLGSFVLDALGVRWAVDLGSDDYNLPGYWRGGRNGKRWSYYRLGSHSHNVVTLDSQQQDPLGRAKVTAFSAERSHVVMDLHSAWPAANRARRGVQMVDRSVLVQDEFLLEAASELIWGMTTRAGATVIDAGNTVRLRQDGKELLVRALAPKGAVWRTRSAERDPPEKRNQGVTRLELVVNARAGEIRIAVQLTPAWPEGSAPPPELRPLSDW